MWFNLSIARFRWAVYSIFFLFQERWHKLQKQRPTSLELLSIFRWILEKCLLAKRSVFGKVGGWWSLNICWKWTTSKNFTRILCRLEGFILKFMAQICLVFYSDLWPLSWKSPHHPHRSCTKIIWHTSGKSSFICSGKKNSHYYQASYYTTCQEESFFQNRKQPFHCKTYLALKVRRTTRRPLIIFFFLWLVCINIQTISINLFSISPNHFN